MLHHFLTTESKAYVRYVPDTKREMKGGTENERINRRDRKGM